MSQPIVVVDAFTDRPFAGNPAGVCLLEGPADDGWMQLVAREMNLSETAFLVPEAGAFRLRWFTPAAEVKLCGHATLASAHWLWASGAAADSQPIAFETLSGRLLAMKRIHKLAEELLERVADMDDRFRGNVNHAGHYPLHCPHGSVPADVVLHRLAAGAGGGADQAG